MKILRNISAIFILILISGMVSSAQQKVQQWDRFEASFKYISKDNSFFDVKLTAVFHGIDTSYNITGFYDGDNTFRIRFMPPEEGTWNYTTNSNVTELNNKKGSFECIKPTGNNHGIVRVSETYNFKYADGKRYYPFGTTAYAWTHMGNELQEITLNTLKESGFNKVRMCVFPKNYDLVKEEPEMYPYMVKEIIKDASGNDIKVWDFDRFDPVFFQHLEKRIDDLKKLGIEADLILFHPYDKGKWGFDAMPNDVNIRYIRYITSRLASFRNIWWSVANEWDLVKYKTHDDWNLLSKTTVECDPYRHLCSIHGSTAKYFEYWKPEFTHLSIQDESPVMNFGAAAILRNAYYKPVIYDEVGYEGNLKHRWGRYSPEEMTYLVWMGVIAGTYVTHGDSYMFKDITDTIFWAKGGTFDGTSWRRIAFLRKIVEDCPNPLQLADVGRDHKTSSAGSGYYIIYFGKEMNDSWQFNLPIRNAAAAFGYKRPVKGTRFKVEIIDTWEMTIKQYPETFETSQETDYRVFDKDFKKVRLPLKPYIALRITEITN
jgi:hypothetical protein